MDAPRPTPAGPPPVPRWVKLLGAAAVLGALVFVVLHFLGGAPTGH